MPDEATVCELCGQPMPPGEEAFRYHGYSGPCPESQSSGDYSVTRTPESAGDE